MLAKNVLEISNICICFYFYFIFGGGEGGVFGVCDVVIERDHTVSFCSNACQELKTSTS